MSAVIVDSAVHVEYFGRMPYFSGLKAMYVCILGSRSFPSVFAAGHSSLIWHQFLPMLLSLPGFRIGMIIALCHISGICPIEIYRLKMFVR